MKKILLLSSVAACVMAVLAAHCPAQPSTHVAWSKIITGTWTFKPIFTTDGSGTSRVTGFLALADPSTLTGDNLVAVWYKREGTAWSASSWRTTNQWEAVESVKLALGIADAEDERWEVATHGSGLDVPYEPTSYTAGVLSTDPIAQMVATSPASEQIVEILTLAGYAAANLPIDAAADCAIEARLDGMSSFALGMIQSGDESVFVTSDSASLCEIFVGVIPRGPAPVKPARPAAPPPWSPPGTIPTAPGGWTPGGWPPAPTAWDCYGVPLSGGGSNCICRREQRWGRWETTTCGFWPITWTCTRWHEIIEREVCTDIGGGCPAGGPPNAQANCNSIHF